MYSRWVRRVLWNGILEKVIEVLARLALAGAERRGERNTTRARIVGGSWREGILLHPLSKGNLDLCVQA